MNRDLPFVLELLGLVTPEGTSREADHDRINGVLSRVVGPMMAEAAGRLDPTIADRQVGGQTFDDAEALQFIVGWRDNAWANAEKLAAAPTPAARAAVAAEIETAAATTSRGCSRPPHPHHLRTRGRATITAWPIAAKPLSVPFGQAADAAPDTPSDGSCGTRDAETQRRSWPGPPPTHDDHPTNRAITHAPTHHATCAPEHRRTG